MSYTRTPEQDAVIRLQGQPLVVGEFACTGKTTTLMRYVQANPQRRMLCLAYNRAIRDEAERKSPFNVECKTSHQLAWAKVGRHYQKRLRGNMRITDVARLRNSRFWPLAKTAQTTLTNFLCSAEPKPRLIHFPPEEDRAGIDPGQMLGAAQILWQEMQCTDGVFPVTHDTYLKLFQLSIPDLATRRDTILFDETQDANPVTRAIVLNQPCRVILVINEVMEVLNVQDNVHTVTEAIKTGPVLNVPADDSREAEEDEGRGSNGDDAVEALC